MAPGGGDGDARSRGAEGAKARWRRWIQAEARRCAGSRRRRGGSHGSRRWRDAPDPGRAFDDVRTRVVRTFDPRCRPDPSGSEPGKARRRQRQRGPQPVTAPCRRAEAATGLGASAFAAETTGRATRTSEGVKEVALRSIGPDAQNGKGDAHHGDDGDAGAQWRRAHQADGAAADPSSREWVRAGDGGRVVETYGDRSCLKRCLLLLEGDEDRDC